MIMLLFTWGTGTTEFDTPSVSYVRRLKVAGLRAPNSNTWFVNIITTRGIIMQKFKMDYVNKLRNSYRTGPGPILCHMCPAVFK